MKEKGTPIYGNFELKQTTTDSILFSCLRDVQKKGLPKMEENGLAFKWSDADPREKPCDFLSIPPLPSYVVIKYPGVFCMIRVDDFLEEEKKDIKKKSLSVTRAKHIAERSVLL